MTTRIDIETNLFTGEETIREHTAEEIKAAAKAQAESDARRQKALDEYDAKLAILNKLGITDEEAKLLLS